MAKKIVSLLTIIAFLVFTQACTIYSAKGVSPDGFLKFSLEEFVRVFPPSAKVVKK